MFTVGFLIGIAVAVAIYELLGRFGKANHSRAFFLRRPFLSAAILCVMFLALAFGIEAVFINKAPYTSVFAKPETYVSVAKEFFFAFVIAMFIIATVELTSRKEQEELIVRASEEAKKSVFDAVYAKSIDPKILEEVEDCIFDSDFLRTQHSNELTLKSLDGDDSFVLLEMIHNFRIKNVSRKERSYSFTAYLPRPSLSRHSDRTRVKSLEAYKVVDGVRGVMIFGETDPAKIATDATTAVESPDEIYYEFASLEVGKGEEIEIVAAIDLVKERFDNEIWTSLMPTLQAEVSVTTEVPGLQLRAISLHRGTMTPKGSVAKDAKSKRWRIDKPLLSYQGYVVSWSALDDDAPAPKEA